MENLKLTNERFNDLKQQARKALAKRDYETVLNNIAGAGIAAYEKMPGKFADDELEKMLSDCAKGIQKSNATPHFESENAEQTDVLVLATTIAHMGGHSEMIRQWIRILTGDGQKTAFFSTEMIHSQFTKAEMCELVGDKNCVEYASKPTFVGRFHELHAFVQRVQPKLIVLVINPQDTISVAVCNLFKGKIPIIFVNHADHLFWLGSRVADTVVEFRRLGAYYSRKYRGVNSACLIPLTSQLEYKPGEKKSNRTQLEELYDIPKKSTLSLSVTTTYKILGSAWSYCDSIVKLLRQNREHHHLLVVSSGKEQFDKYIKGSGVEDRFHISNLQKNLVPYYQSADFLIEGFPFKGGMVRNDAFKIGLPTIVIDFPQSQENTEIQGLPEGYPVVSNEQELLELATQFICEPKLRNQFGKQVNALYKTHFSESRVRRLILTVVQKAKNSDFPDAFTETSESFVTDFNFYRELGVLSDADMLFYAGKNTDGIQLLQRYFSPDDDSENYQHILQKMKYSHIDLPYAFRPMYRAALIAKDGGDLSKALVMLGEISQLVPEFAPAYLQTAECLFQSGESEKSLEAIQLYVENSTGKQQKTEALCIQGRYFTRVEQHDRAIDAYKTALALMPNQPEIMFWLAESYAKNGAAAECKKLVGEIAILPNVPEAVAAKANALGNAQTANVNCGNETDSPDVSIVIPLFNRIAFTKNCIQTIFSLPQENTTFEIILVDNGSTDETPQYLDEVVKQHPHIRVIRNRENLGFSQACNIGAKAAAGKYLYFLNNDTEPKVGWLDHLAEILDADIDVAAVGSKLLFPDGTLQHAGVVAVDDRKSGDPLALYHDYYKQPNSDAYANILMEYTALTAASLMVRKSAFQLVDGFDEGFWNGYEDVDLCFKLRMRGWKLVYQPKSVLVHHESQSGPERFAKVNENVRRLHQRWLNVVAPDYIVTAGAHPVKTADFHVQPYVLPKTVQSALSTKKNPLVSIVILTYNQLDKTKPCLASVAKFTRKPYEVIVVDNASTDGTPKFLRNWQRKIKHHKIMLNTENKGFAGGNNQGIRLATGEYIVLLNNDTIVTEGWLERLLRPFQNDESVGLVGPMSNYVAGAQLERGVSYQTDVELQNFASNYAKLFDGKVQYVHRLVGFCLAISRAVVKEIGVLDLRFGKGNYEDDDYSLRASQAGFKLAIARDVFIHHHGNSSFKANNINYLKSLEENRQIFLDKWKDLQRPEQLLIDILLEEADWRLHLNETDAAESVLYRAFELSPGNKTIAEKLEKLLAAQEKFTEMFALLQKYVVANPTDHEAFNALGMMHWQNSAIADAIVAFQKAVAIAPNVVDYQKNLADACLSAERFDEGIHLLLQLIKSNPSDPESYEKLASLYVEAGHLQSAYDLLDQARQYNPQHTQLNEWLNSVQEAMNATE
ncbi:MAG: glycosyltransferase [Calditrichia bacterium]